LMVLAVRTRSSERRAKVAPVSRFFAKMDTVPLKPAVAAEILSLSDAACATVRVSSKRGRNMRTIVAFLLTSIAAAQTSPDVERLEKRLADQPGNASNRQAIQRALTNFQAAPEKLRADRRDLILWLIEHQPESKMFEEPFTLLWTRGRLGDPEGFERAAQLWKDQAAKDGATEKTVANAALFFRVMNPAQGFAILDGAEREHPGNPELARARGILHAFVMLGVSAIDDNNRILLTTSGALRAAPAAAEARQEIEASKDAHLLGAAGEVLTHYGTISIPYDLTFGDDDVPTLAERWLGRARELGLPEAEWRTPLGDAIHRKAERTNDPREKLRLLAESYDLAPDPVKPGIRVQMAVAEFAAGDDAAAEKDAQPMAEAPHNTYEFNLAETLLGRIALARGDSKEAKERLGASLKPPAKFKNPVFEPNMTLAQDVYDAGDHDAVLEFLEASRAVWKTDRGRIDRMISFVKKAPTVDLVQLSRQFPGSEFLRRPSPAFEAMDAEGRTWTREQLTGKVVALEFGTAPLAEKVSRDFAARGAVLLQIQNDDIRRRFEVLTNPTVVVIDRQGNVSSYRAGAATEAEWRNEWENGFGRGTNPAPEAPKQLETMEAAGGKAALSWEPVDNAESYVVEWDSRDENGWIYDRDRSVRVIATRDTSTVLDLTGFTRVRWRVYAVPRSGPAGSASPWRELDGTPVTKIYK
jgi:hypothetical protein